MSGNSEVTKMTQNVYKKKALLKVPWWKLGTWNT